MMELGQIIIADDEEFFLSTAELLRREGYNCTHASNVAAARDALLAGGICLLIAGMPMPGNQELELVEELPEIAEGTPVILVADNPSPGSLIAAVRLRVEACLIKPVDSTELLECVRNAIERFRTYHTMNVSLRRLGGWYEDLAGMKEHALHAPAGLPVKVFLDLTLQNIVEALLDIRNLADAAASREGEQDACHLLGCPRVAALSDAVQQAIAVLEKTKGEFKSKQLGELRRKLEGTMKLD
jgi:DNA-binding response OmpR family regulator